MPQVPMIRLYHFPLSPFCRKVRLTLAEKRLEVELVEERYWEQDPEFLRRNPAGKVPVLKMDTKLMTESQAICEYLEETVPNPALMPRDAETRHEVRPIQRSTRRHRGKIAAGSVFFVCGFFSAMGNHRPQSGALVKWAPARNATGGRVTPSPFLCAQTSQRLAKGG